MKRNNGLFSRSFLLFQMKRFFRSRLPQGLTPDEIDQLSSRSQLPPEDIQEWYQRFTHCYPRGYLSFNEFIDYLNRFHNQTNETKKPMTKTMIKQIFRLLDINQDKNLNFDEFFLFHLLINQSSAEDKLRTIFKLYDQGKNKSFTRAELSTILTQMFDVLNISKPNGGLEQAIDTIIQRSNINVDSEKIVWNTFRIYVLQDPLLFQLLLNDEDGSMYITTRL